MGVTSTSAVDRTSAMLDLSPEYTNRQRMKTTDGFEGLSEDEFIRSAAINRVSWKRWIDSTDSAANLVIAGGRAQFQELNRFSEL